MTRRRVWQRDKYRNPAYSLQNLQSEVWEMLRTANEVNSSFLKKQIVLPELFHMIIE